jgi:hypothetical protein
MMSRITLSLKKERLRSPTLNRHSESIFPVCFGCQTSLLGSLRPHPPAPGSPWRNSKVLPRPQRLVHSRVRTMKVVRTGRHQFQGESMELTHNKDLYKVRSESSCSAGHIFMFDPCCRVFSKRCTDCCFNPP